MNQYYTLSAWEAIDLLTEVMIKYAIDTGLNDQADYLRGGRNFHYLMRMCSYLNSDKVAVEINKKEHSGSSSKAGRGQHTKLIYDIAQNVQKGHLNILGYKSLTALLTYIDDEKRINEYIPAKKFEPDYIFRDKFVGSKWEMHFWDYSINSNGQKEEGITIGDLRFENYHTVFAHIYRPRERGRILYKGSYERYRADYLKIRLRATNSNTQAEEDVSLLMYIGDGNVTLSLGQYRDVENGAIISGTIVMNRIENDTTIIPQFFAKGSDDYKSLDGNIAHYLNSKDLNYLKTPKKVTSMYEFADWFNKHISRRAKPN